MLRGLLNYLCLTTNARYLPVYAERCRQALAQTNQNELVGQAPLGPRALPKLQSNSDGLCDFPHLTTKPPLK